MRKTLLTAAALALTLGAFAGAGTTDAFAARNSAKTIQKGTANKSGIKQAGSDNSATTMQFGNGHKSRTTQSGDGNMAGTLQLGNGTDCNIDQSGGDIDFCLGL